MKRILGGYIFIFILLLGSCQKKVDIFIPDSIQNSPDTVWQNTLTAGMPVISLKQDLRATLSTDSFSYNNTGIVYNNGSLSLSIPSNGLVAFSGSIPSGNVIRQSLLRKSKGDLIAQGISATSNGRLLVSGGVFFTGLKNNGQDLTVATGKTVSVKYDNILSAAGMKVFNSTEDDINGFNWLPNADTAFNKVNVSGNGYEVLINKLQWVQAAYLFDTTGIPEITFNVTLPSLYTNANTIAFISFNDMQCVAALTGVAAARSFVSGPLPINKPVTVIVISRQAGDYYLSMQQTNTSQAGSGLGVQTINITPIKTSLAGIKSALSNL